jgi:RNA-directed DNA polymerase
LTSTQLRDRWNSYVQGWWGYYSLVEWRRPIFQTEGWTRRHIRKCFWLRWHKSKGRVAALKRLGVPAQRALIGRSSRGAWPMARHAVMQEALSNKTLKRYGFLLPSDLTC